MYADQRSHADSDDSPLRDGESYQQDEFAGGAEDFAGGHLPGRPTWDCLSCEKPWPCDPARERLAAENTGTGLAVLMWSYLEDYAGDAGPGPLGEAFERFIAWTRRPVLPQPRSESELP